MAFSLLIKPASADCNMRCSYCFYLNHLSENRPQPRMSPDTLENLISGYMKSEQEGEFTFCWQGGEPTLMGLDFFKKVIELQKRYAPPGALIQNSLQTNGALINDKLAEFLSEYNFLLGVSLDGPPEIHDHYRKSIGGGNTHSKVLKGIEKLEKYNVEFNLLTLINDQNVKKPAEVFRYFADRDWNYQQYIPCVEFDKDGSLKPFSVSGDEWGDFLCRLFDEWLRRGPNKISIRRFDSILRYLVHNRYAECYMQKNCRQYFVVEYDGGVYPCDFFVREDLRLGNVNVDGWDKIGSSPLYGEFGSAKSRFSSLCKSCSYVELCNGDCQKHGKFNLDSERGISELCRGWKKFYTYTLPAFKKIAEDIKSGSLQVKPESLPFSKPSRNELCPCGSGSKYKKCCSQ